MSGQLPGSSPHTVSKLAKFESPDPMYWCYQGYAVANVDVRGAGHSEGNVHMFTHQDREDGYDFVEWIATQHWCNGNVGMAEEVSGVAMHQWGIAAMQPPHLKCIAPGSVPQIFIVSLSTREVCQHYPLINLFLHRLRYWWWSGQPGGYGSQNR